MLPRTRRVHGISKRRRRKHSTVAFGCVHCGLVSVTGSNLSDNARPSKDVKEGIVHYAINSQLKLGDIRAVLFLAAHICPRFSHRLRTAGFAEITVS